MPSCDMAQEAQKYEPDFLNAVARVLHDEGGYVNDPSDAGGETNFGISKRSNPDVDIKNLTAEQATDIYWNQWWLRYGFYKLKGDVAGKVFNLAVLMGASHAVIILQRALRACSGIVVTETGDLNVQTTMTANSALNTDGLLAAIRSEAAGYFRAVAMKGDNDKFLDGWLKRAYS
jgi:lysozyme family protein